MARWLALGVNRRKLFWRGGGGMRNRMESDTGRNMESVRGLVVLISTKVVLGREIGLSGSM